MPKDLPTKLAILIPSVCSPRGIYKEEEGRSFYEKSFWIIKKGISHGLRNKL